MKIPFESLSSEQLRQVGYVATLLLAEGFVREGYFDLSSISDVDLIEKINESVKNKFIRGEETLSLTFDHTDKLLE